MPDRTEDRGAGESREKIGEESPIASQGVGRTAASCIPAARNRPAFFEIHYLETKNANIGMRNAYSCNQTSNRPSEPRPGGRLTASNRQNTTIMLPRQPSL